jgi:hypothetical protein
MKKKKTITEKSPGEGLFKKRPPDYVLYIFFPRRKWTRWFILMSIGGQSSSIQVIGVNGRVGGGEGRVKLWEHQDYDKLQKIRKLVK